MSTINPDGSLTLTPDERNELVEWASEIGDLSYVVAPDPDPTGVGIRERVQSIKHVLLADPPAPPPPTLRTMYDAVNWQAIPADAEIVAGYVDGAYKWPQEAWDRFPNAIKVRIAVFPWTNDGDVLDVEPGDATPGSAPSWIRMRQRAGLAVPTIYCDRARWPQVEKACNGLTYNIWLADWTAQPHIPDGVVACQYADPAAGSGGDYDVSVCSEAWPT